jgi:hypothetical protein
MTRDSKEIQGNPRGDKGVFAEKRGLAKKIQIDGPESLIIQ